MLGGIWLGAEGAELADLATSGTNLLELASDTAEAADSGMVIHTQLTEYKEKKKVVSFIFVENQSRKTKSPNSRKNPKKYVLFS